MKGWAQTRVATIGMSWIVTRGDNANISASKIECTLIQKLRSIAWH